VHLLNINHLKINKYRFKVWKNCGIEIEKNLFTYLPFTILPYYDLLGLNSYFIGRNLARFSVPPLRRILEKYDFQNVDILWFGDCGLIGIKDIIGYDKLVVRAADELAGMKGCPRSILKLERELMEQADHIFATAHDLYEKAARYNKSITYLPNGVEAEHFINTNFEKPVEYKNINAPIIVYAGNLGWVDFGLLDYCVKKLGDFIFVIIGPVIPSMSNLSDLPNVKILGWRDYKFLPPYLQWANVGIITFKKCPVTDATNPIKLYEYSASGIPTVVTSLNEISKMNCPVLIGSTYKDFADAIIKAYEMGKDPNFKIKLQDFARRHSWMGKYNQIKATLNLL